MSEADVIEVTASVPDRRRRLLFSGQAADGCARASLNRSGRIGTTASFFLAFLRCSLRCSCVEVKRAVEGSKLTGLEFQEVELT